MMMIDVARKLFGEMSTLFSFRVEKLEKKWLEIGHIKAR